MSHEHETPDAGANAVEDPARESGPDYIARARRILGGDVRPDDYLPVTPEVEEGVARDLAAMRAHVRAEFEAGRIPAMFELDPCVEIRQRNMWLLAVHYGGQIIVSTENDSGAIVLAVGLENCAALLRAIPNELVVRFGLGMYAPDDLDAPWM